MSHPRTIYVALQHELCIAQNGDRSKKAVAAQPLAAAVGKDLQFIRFNGAMVGGLAGLALYSGEMLLRFV
jgi:uncharacterized membrane-anchored protein YjiN (DUF445 family)